MLGLLLYASVTTASGAFLLFTGPTTIPGSVDLTAQGANDWTHWSGSTNSLNRKAGVSAKISNYTQIGSEVPVGAGSQATYIWSDGTPSASANSNTGARLFNLNNGFRVTIPADTSTRDVNFYIGAKNARGRFIATLSDASADPLEFLIDQPSGLGTHLVTMSYQANSAGQTLTIEYTMETRYNASLMKSQINLEAVTLIGGGSGGGGNNPPIITNPGNQTNTEGDTVSLQIQATDLDLTDMLTYGATNLPTGVSIDPNTGLISGTTTSANTFNTTVTVNDGNGGTDSESFSWTVNMSGGGGPTVSYEFENLTITNSDGTTNFIQSKSSGSASNGAYFQYNSNAVGEYVTFPISVSAAGTYNLNLQYSLAPARGTFLVEVSDNPNGPYTEIDRMDTTVPSGSSATFESLPMTSSFSSAGTYYLRFRVTGSNPGTGSERMGLDKIDVTPQGGGGNNPPIITNPGNQTNTEDDTVSLQIQATDLDATDMLTYGATNLPTGVSINPNTGLITGTTTSANTFNTTVTVNDGNGGTDSESFSWTVNTSGGGNNPPTVANPGNQTNTEGDTVSLQIQATDLDATDMLTYGATNLPTGVSINPNTGLITGTTTSANTFNTTVTVNDGNGGTDSESFSWTVNTSGGGNNEFQQSSDSDNLLVVEAENFHNNVSQGGQNWTVINNGSASGGVAMEATPNIGTNNGDNYVTSSPRLDFDVNFVTTGTHYVWVRGLGPNLGADSVHIGLDGVDLASSKRIDDFTTNTWDWSNLIQVAPGNLQVATIEVTSSGSHTLNIWMREDGFLANKLLLTTNSSYAPAGDGPSESTQNGGGGGGGGGITLPFTDDFNDGNAQGWIVSDEAGNPSNWVATNNQYQQTNQVRAGSVNLQESYHIASFSYLDEGFELQNYQATVNVIPRGDLGDDIGVMFRYLDTNNYYRLTFDSRFGYTRLEKRVNGQFSTLASNSIGYELNQSVEVGITVVGSQIQVDLDGNPLFSVDDNSHSQGTIALYSAADSRFDNVQIQNANASSIGVSSPNSHSIITTNRINASAIAVNAPAGARVDFILDGVTTRSDNSAPFSKSFRRLVQGEHTIEAELYDSGGNLIASDLNTVIGTQGDSYLTIGDSLTNGARDNYAADNVSVDGRIFGFQGYQARLNDLLTQTRGYPHIVVNEGIGGDDSNETLNLRLNSILARNPDSNQMLMFLGANDSGGSMPIPSGMGCSSASCNGTFKGNMQGIIDTANKSVFVAQAAPVFGNSSTSTPYSNPLGTTRNGTIQEYNQVVVNELTNRSLGPNLFECFLSSTDNRFSLFADNFHPNGLGYAVISQLWHDIITGTTLATAPCVPPIFVLEDLSDSTVAPYNKQNLIEVGDEYYVDRTHTITSIPTGLGLNNGRWIMTANDDRMNSSNNYLSFDVDRNVTVFVAYDNRASALPNWLRSSNGFNTSGDQINVSQSGTTFDLYSKSFPPSTITLGGNLAAGANGATENYIVIVVEQ